MGVTVSETISDTPMASAQGARRAASSRSGSARWKNSSTVPVGEWTHVAVSYDPNAAGGTVKLPDQSELARAREILEELRRRAGEATLALLKADLKPRERIQAGGFKPAGNSIALNIIFHSPQLQMHPAPPQSPRRHPRTVPSHHGW